MIQGLTEHLFEHWDALVGGRWPRPRAVHWLKFGHVGDFPRPYTYFYLFFDGEGEPALVAKVTADRAARARLVREFDQVQRLRHRVGLELAHTIPAPLAGVPYGSHWVGLEEYAGGRRFVPAVMLDRHGREAPVARYVRSVVDWLIAFGQSGLAPVQFDDEIYRHAVEEPVARLKTWHHFEGEESTLLAELTAELARFRGQTVNALALHGDLWPGNIFVRGTRLRVIDWDGYRERDTSYHDIHTFMSSFSVSKDARGAEPEASLIATYFIENWFSRLLRSEFTRYVDRLELDPDLTALMLPMYLVRMATRREPVSVSARAMNAKFAGLLMTFLRWQREHRLLLHSHHRPSTTAANTNDQPSRTPP